MSGVCRDPNQFPRPAEIRKLRLQGLLAQPRFRLPAAPQFQLRPNFAGPFAHARQSPVTGPSFLDEDLGADAFSIIANAHSQLPVVVTNGNFHVMCLCMTKRTNGRVGR